MKQQCRLYVDIYEGTVFMVNLSAFSENGCIFCKIQNLNNRWNDNISLFSYQLWRLSSHFFCLPFSIFSYLTFSYFIEKNVLFFCIYNLSAKKIALPFQNTSLYKFLKKYRFCKIILISSYSLSLIACPRIFQYRASTVIGYNSV